MYLRNNIFKTMLIQKDIDIQDRHSFHCPARTQYWVDYDKVDELRQVLLEARDFGLPIMSIGGGCNLLFTDNYEGILLHSCIKEWRVLSKDKNSVLVEVGAGMSWDAWVALSVEQGWSGLQNLSGIPGDVGASPVQNIGAYGVEAKDCIESVVALNRDTLETEVLPAADCAFGYRMSRFKQDWKERYVVCYVRFRLSLNPEYRLDYGRLREEVEHLGEPSLQTLRQAVLQIRRSKLPDPDQTGNAGSFFKNPCVTADRAQALLERYPSMPFWPQNDGSVKLSAAWVIDTCGWKGYREGDAGVCATQALVLVNYGQATGKDVMQLYRKIAADVAEKFMLELQPEVVILP